MGIVRLDRFFTFFPSFHLFFIWPKKKKVNETAVMRLDYGDPTLGTCKETVEGGNHFRYWTQTGSEADRCAYLPWSMTPFFQCFLVAPCLWLFRMSFRKHVSPRLTLPFKLYVDHCTQSEPRHHL